MILFSSYIRFILTLYIYICRLFTVSSISDGRSSSTVPTDSALTMSGIHNYTAKQNGFDLKSILDNVSLYNSLDRESSTSSSLRGTVGSQYSSATQTLRRWTELVTLSHAEERLCVALSYGSESDALRWLGEWVFFCCKTNLHSRLSWLIESLASATRDQGTNMSSDSHPHDNEYDTRMNDYKTQKEKSIYLLKSIVLPVIESSGCMKAMENDVKRLIESLI